ncbi:MAG: DUF1295 domain-containing protein [Nitriliruptorales bacterium]|nr:DUF1295 domain-containing protein [Nitriliruptorales bacterium]
MGNGEVALAGGLAALAVMVVTWLASLVQRDVSLVDRVWGLGFVAMAWTYAVAVDGGSRILLAAVLITVWGLRLSVYITARNWGDGEDPRYAAMRAKRPDTFAVRSLVTVFVLQGALAWLVALPLYGIAISGPDDLGWLDVIGVAIWAVGFTFEAVGDWQLSRFLGDEANRGRVLDTGLWRWTRHPNYFGDATMWWGIGVIGLAAGAWWGLVGPALMMVLIVKVSGVALTDRNMAGKSKREGHAAYVARTSAFFPRPPRKLTDVDG